jgi:acyl-CoA synthetase (NDP forming)/ribosomal protein S18 acetylase RimI-like enzyme
MGGVADPGYPIAWEADVLLRDGRPVHLRPITPEDGPALRAFHRSLSAQTVYFRFFSAKPELTDRDVDYFTGVDHVDRVALVALDQGELIGVGRFDALGDGRAEVAFIIHDSMQGRGLGSVLLEHLAAAARERGIRRFVAEVLPENGRMLATFREAGYEIRQRREEDVLAVSFDIEPTSASMAVMSAREHRAEARSVQRLLQPASVAVVGASRSPGGLGHELLRNLVAGGFTGELLAVHPEVDEIAGVRCVRSLADAGAPVDLAVVAVRAERVAGVIEEAAAAGVHGLVVISGGFGDSGPDGLALQAGLVSTVHRTGMRLVGPNALGLINTDPAVRLNASLVPEMPAGGRVGFFSQSGALGASILERFRRRGLGLSTFVSAGNRADISGNDLLQYWEEDPRTDLVVLYLETIGNARKFARIVHRMSETKPVVMVRAGGAGQQHPLGHAVASTLLSQRAVDQVLADCGLIVADSVHQVMDVARLLAGQPLPTGSGVAVVGNSDALAVLAVNGIHRTSLDLARPPVTFARQESVTAYESAIHAAFDDEAVGAVLAIYVPPIEHRSGTEIRAALRACAGHGAARGKPVVAVMLSQEGEIDPEDVPVFADIEDALQALDAVSRYARWRAQDHEPAVPDEATTQAPEPEPRPGTLHGAAAATLLLDTGRAPVVDAASGVALGCHVRLLDDPLYGPVMVVGIDDPVAEALDDRAYRLAPVTPAGARAMLDSLGSLPVLTGDSAHPERLLDELSHAISDLSLLPATVPGLNAAELRHAGLVDGHLTVRRMSATIGDTAVVTDPAARRL